MVLVGEAVRGQPRDLPGVPERQKRACGASRGPYSPLRRRTVSGDDGVGRPPAQSR